MNDLKEAGSYLFVSGERKPGYLAAIDIFMEHFVTMKSKNRLLSLPGRIHRVNVDDWPTNLVDELNRLGFIDEIRKYQRGHIIHSPSRKWTGRMAEIGCGTLIITLTLLAIVGLFTVINLLVSM